MVLMICRKYPAGDVWFEAMTSEQLDAEFDRATRGEKNMTVEHFEEWLPTFKAGYLRERRLLEQLEVETAATEATVRGLPSAQHMAVAVRAIAKHCQQLESLTLRGAVSPESVRLLASACGERLRCLDLSATTVDDKALRVLSQGCTALQTLRLVECPGVGPAGITELAALPSLAAAESKGLRLVLSEEASEGAGEAMRAALAELPASCVVVRAADAGAGAAVGDDSAAPSPAATGGSFRRQRKPSATSKAAVQLEQIGMNLPGLPKGYFERRRKKKSGCCVLM